MTCWCVYIQAVVWGRWCWAEASEYQVSVWVYWSCSWCMLGCLPTWRKEHSCWWGGGKWPVEETTMTQRDELSYFLVRFQSISANPVNLTVPRGGCEDIWCVAHVCGQTGSGMWRTGRADTSSEKNSDCGESFGSICQRRPATPGRHTHCACVGLWHAWTESYRTDPEEEEGEDEEEKGGRKHTVMLHLIWEKGHLPSVTVLASFFSVKMKLKVQVITWETFSYSPLDEDKCRMCWNLWAPPPELGASSNPPPKRFLKNDMIQIFRSKIDVFLEQENNDYNNCFEMMSTKVQ